MADWKFHVPRGQGMNSKGRQSHCRDLPRAAVSLCLLCLYYYYTKRIGNLNMHVSNVAEVKNDALLQARTQTELSTRTNVIKLQRNATKNVCCRKHRGRKSLRMQLGVQKLQEQVANNNYCTYS